jgi:Family of unknown function (DUF5990)
VTVAVRVTITGRNLPGRVFRAAGEPERSNVHVGVQLGRDPSQLVRADALEACWDVDVNVEHKDGMRDFRGVAVQGKRGDRFLYLTWGEVGADGGFEMFRRAKLMLDRVDPELMDRAVSAGRLAAVVDLTGDDGCPRCARVDPPAVAWSVPAR